MDHSPIRQAFKFENNFSTVRKSFLNLVKLWSLVVKYCKMSKYSNLKFANFVYFCITREKALPHFHIVVRLFRPLYKNIQNSQTLQDYIFHILQFFATKLHNFTKFRKLFPTVLELFSNLKVCTIGEWPIEDLTRLGLGLKFNFAYWEHGIITQLGQPGWCVNSS